MKLKRGLKLKSKKSNKTAILKREGGMGHWDCDCDGKNHKIHRGTLLKYYEEIKQQ